MGFAVLALLMACVGLYGTMSYNVTREVGELGIRMALGAQRGAVVWMVLRRVLMLAAVGSRSVCLPRWARSGLSNRFCSRRSPMIRESSRWPV